MLSNLLIYYISEVRDLWPSQNELYESICLFLERKQNATPYLWGGDNYIELLKFIPFLYLFLPCLALPLHLCTTLHISPPCAKQKQTYVIVCIRNQSLYIRTAVISVIIYNDQLKPVIIHNDQLKPVIIYNDQQFSLPFHKQTSFLYNSNNCLKRQNQTFL